jgi:hypothetical protein
LAELGVRELGNFLTLLQGKRSFVSALQKGLAVEVDTPNRSHWRDSPGFSIRKHRLGRVHATNGQEQVTGRQHASVFLGDF